MSARSPLRLTLPILTLAACGGEIPADFIDEDTAAAGSSSRPVPVCGAACTTNEEKLFWKGHDSVPQVFNDVGVGKTARDAMYCLFRDANGAELGHKSVGSGWKKQGVTTRVIVSSATPPTASSFGTLTGWHAMSLTVFGQTLDADVQWFELRFPTESIAPRVWSSRLDPRTGVRIPLYETPTGYYADVRSSRFNGSKNLYGQWPQPTLTLNVVQPAILEGADVQPWSATTDRVSYPSWEVGTENMQWGQLLGGSTPSDKLRATIPIVSAKWIRFELFVDALARHFLRFHEEGDPDRAGGIGAAALEMGTKTSFELRAKVTVDLGWFGDYTYEKKLFTWTPVDVYKTLGAVGYTGRTLTMHRRRDGGFDANPQAWLNACLVAPPLPPAPVPSSDVDAWVNGVKGAVLNNVIDCTELPDGEIPLGALCDKFRGPLPTYP